MAPKASAGRNAYREMLEEHGRRFERLTERRGVARIKTLYEESQAEVARKLAKVVKAGRGSSFTAHQHRQVLAQLTHGQAMVADKMAGELTAAAREAQVDTLQALGKNISRVQSKVGDPEQILPIEDASRFWGVIDKRKTSMMRAHESSMGEYGQRLVGKMEKQMSLGLMQGETQNQIIDRVIDTADVEWWQGERIVRTELSWAANATQTDGMVATLETLPDLMMRWTEFVSDDGMPMDDRVGDDSLAMHGQLARPGAMFTQPAMAPDGSPVSVTLAGSEFPFPPNRPNDRAVVAPWRSNWGIPGWRYVGGRRVPMR